TRRKSGNDLPQTRNMGRTADGTCFENRITGFLEIGLRQSAGHTYGNEVHHDRIDDFMRTESSLQHTRDACPCSAAEDRGQTCQRNQNPCRTMGKRNPGPSRRKCRDCELTLGSNVKQTTTKADGDGESGEYKRRCIEECVANPVRPGDCAADKEA